MNLKESKRVFTFYLTVGHHIYSYTSQIHLLPSNLMILLFFLNNILLWICTKLSLSFFFWHQFSLVPPPWHCEYISNKYDSESVSLVKYEVLCVNAHNDMANLYINSIHGFFGSSILMSMLVIWICRSITVIGMECYHTNGCTSKATLQVHALSIKVPTAYFI